MNNQEWVESLKVEARQRGISNINCLIQMLKEIDGDIVEQKQKWKMDFGFEVDKDWKPLDVACWYGCPFSCLTRLGEVCRARSYYEETGEIICPVIKRGASKVFKKE